MKKQYSLVEESASERSMEVNVSFVRILYTCSLQEYIKERVTHKKKVAAKKIEDQSVIGLTYKPYEENDKLQKPQEIPTRCENETDCTKEVQEAVIFYKAEDKDSAENLNENVDMKLEIGSVTVEVGGLPHKSCVDVETVMKQSVIRSDVSEKGDGLDEQVEQVSHNDCQTNSAPCVDKVLCLEKEVESKHSVIQYDESQHETIDEEKEEKAALQLENTACVKKVGPIKSCLKKQRSVEDDFVFEEKDVHKVKRVYDLMEYLDLHVHKHVRFSVSITGDQSERKTQMCNKLSDSRQIRRSLHTISDGEYKKRMQWMQLHTTSDGEYEKKMQLHTISDGDYEKRMQLQTISDGEYEKRMQLHTISGGEYEKRMQWMQNVQYSNSWDNKYLNQAPKQRLKNPSMSHRSSKTFEDLENYLNTKKFDF